jgi:hypothetical protein
MTSTPPFPLAATKVKYSAADERTTETSFFLGVRNGFLLLIPAPSNAIVSCYDLATAVEKKPN